MKNNGAGLSVRATKRARTRTQRLVASFAAFALVAGIGFTGQWSQSAIPQAEAAVLVGGQPTTQGVKPVWQPLLNYDAVWMNGGLREDATYWTADANPSSSLTAAPVPIVGMQYNWAENMNTFEAAPVLAIQRVATKTVPGFTPPGVPAGSLTTSLSYNNWETTAAARIGGTKDNPGGPLSLYTWDNGGSHSFNGMSCNNSSAGYPSDGYTPVLRFTNNDPTIYWACMPIADRNSTPRLGGGDAWGGEADQYTGNIYVSGALGGNLDGQGPGSTSANNYYYALFTVWNPQTGMYTLSNIIQPGDWYSGMKTPPQERVALQRNVNGSNGDHAEVSADFVMDAEGNIYVYVGNSVGGSTAGAWNAKIVRIEPTRDANGNITQGTTDNPWRYYVVSSVKKDPAYPTLSWNDAGSIWGNAFINGQMLLTANLSMGNYGTVPATANMVGRTLMVKIDPLTNTARPVWSTNNLPGTPTAATHDSASPQGAQVISGRLYNDEDGDGVLPRDADGAITAPGLYNQSVALYDSHFTLLAVHQTDTSGRYDFIVSGREDSVYYLRPLQVQIPLSDGTMINAAQTWALGSRESGMNSLGVMVTNDVGVVCYNAEGGKVTDDSTRTGGPCYGALNPASADPPAETINAQSDQATWLTYAKADLHTSAQVPTADFAFTINGSYGDSAAGPTTADIPVHINTDPATSVWFGDNPGNHTGPVTTNTHSTDDGIVVTTYDGVTVPLSNTTLAATGAYTITGNLSGEGKTGANATGWVSGLGTTTWNVNPAWQPTVVGEKASGTFRFQQSGVVSGSPEVQFRAQVSTATITQPTNISGQYSSIDALTGGPNWTTPGEIEDHTFRVADAVYRPAVKTVSGSATFTIDGQSLTANSAAFTLGTATIVSANTTKTVVAEAPNSSWVLASATVKRTSDGAVLDNATPSKVSDTRTQITWPVALGDDVRVELVYGKAPDPNKSSLSIEPNSTIVGGSLTATVTVKDADGNLLGNQVVSFSNVSDDVVIEQSSCTTDETTGACSVDITSDIAGTYTDEISAKVGAGSAAANVTGSPKTVIFTSAKGDPSKSSLAVTPAGPLEVGTSAANTYTATVLVKDGPGNVVPDQEVRFTVTNLDGSAVSSQTKLSDDHCETKATGSCYVTLTSTKPGTYLISATIEDPGEPGKWVDVQGSSATVVYAPKQVCVVEAGCTPQPGVTNVTHVQVTVNNALNDGVATDEITAYTYDEWGNPVAGGVKISTSDIALTLAGTGTIATDAITGQGTLKATSTVSGPHTATASVGGIPLSPEHGSPMQLNFTAQAAVSSKSTLVLSSLEQEVGTVVTATVTTIDTNGQTVAGTQVKFGLAGPTYATFIDGASCTTDAEGTCSVTFTDIKAETVTVHARLGSAETVDIKDSPASTRFTTTAFCPSHSRWTVAPTTTGTVADGLDPRYPIANGNGTGGDYYTATLSAYDCSDNAMKDLDTSTIVVEATGLPTLEISPVVNNGDGTYSVTIASKTSGDAIASVTYDGGPKVGPVTDQTLKFQAGKVCIPSATVPCGDNPAKQTRAEVNPNGAKADGQDTDGIIVYAFDKEGNPVETTFTLLSIDHAVLDSATVGTDPITGQGSTTATSTVAGSQRVQVSVGGQLLTSLPQGMLPLLFTLVETPTPEPNPPVTETSTLSLDRTTQAAGGTVTATVTARDANNDPVANTTIVVSVNQAATVGPDGAKTVSCRTEATGVCIVTLTDTVAEQVSVHATLNQNGEAADILGSPATVIFTDAGPCLASASPACVPDSSVPDSHRTRVEVGTDYQLVITGTDVATVYVFDRFGNPSSGATIASTTSDPALAIGDAIAKTNAKGESAISYTSSLPGGHEAVVTINGTPVAFIPQGSTLIDVSKSSPITLNFVQASTPAPNPTTSALSLDRTTQVAGGTVIATVTARDANNRTIQGASVVVSVNQSATVGLTTAKSVTCTTNEVGVCTVTITDTVAEQISVRATVNQNGTAADIVGSPATVTFTDSGPCVAPCQPDSTVPDSHRTRVEVTTNNQPILTGADVATVYVFDRFGNPSSGATIASTTSDPALAIGDAIAKTDAKGESAISYTSSLPGGHEAVVTINGTPVAFIPQGSTLIDVSKSSPVTLHFVDNVAPERPKVTSPKPGAQLGDSTPDVIGTAEPGSTVSVKDKDSGTVLCQAIADASGNYTCTPDPDHELGDGPHTLVVTAADPSGNVSAAVEVPVNVDTLAPHTPAIDWANSTEISGRAEPGMVITVTVPGVADPKITTADENGKWLVPTPPGAHDNGIVHVIATDAAGNDSLEATTTLDTSAPPVPTVEKANETEISGTAEPGSTISVTVPGVKHPVISTVGPDGKWSVTTPDDAQEGMIRVTATDPAGNRSPEATAYIDLTEPGAPKVDKANATEVSGTAERGSTVTVVFPDGTKLTTTADPDSGAYIVTTPQDMPDGGRITVTATDPAGNVSPPTVVALDTVAPSSPTIDRADAIEISGTAEPGSTVTIKVPGVDKPSTVVVGENGSWKVATPQGTKDGTVRVTATDPAGNISAEVTRQIKTSAPSKPVVNPSNGSEVSGKADPGSMITITDENGNNVPCKNADGTVSASVVVGSDGTFMCVPDKVLTPGTSITVVAKDSSGLDSDRVTISIGDVAVEVAYPERHRRDSQVVTGYRFNVGEQVCLVVNSDPWAVGCEKADGEGTVTFTFAVPADFDLGVHTVTVTGRASGLAASTSFAVVDTISIATGGSVQTDKSFPLRGFLHKT